MVVIKKKMILIKFKDISNSGTKTAFLCMLLPIDKLKMKKFE